MSIDVCYYIVKDIRFTMVLLIGDRDIDEISITPEEVIEVVEDAYR